MAKDKKTKNEVIPEGMEEKDYADAAFRKKVTIINGVVLLAFLVGIVSIVLFGWADNKRKNEEFFEIKAAYEEERDNVLAELQEIDNKGGTFEDKRSVKIEVTDDTFSYWLSDLDKSYQGDRDTEDYGKFGGAEIHIQGIFVTREYAGGNQYWVYRLHSHGEGENHGAAHNHSDEGDEDALINGHSIDEILPFEVVLADGEEVPKDGQWVDVVGVVGPDSTKNLSGIRSAVVTVMD
ncbi:MAG: hypothetical protein KIG53_06855, partial [Oscillospiraceae bacterium]|nr:hypothetical protein [Oscillospiraceae bacterium]